MISVTLLITAGLGKVQMNGFGLLVALMGDLLILEAVVEILYSVCQ